MFLLKRILFHLMKIFFNSVPEVIASVKLKVAITTSGVLHNKHSVQIQIS
jgi:hypothetical protein